MRTRVSSARPLATATAVAATATFALATCGRSSGDRPVTSMPVPPKAPTPSTGSISPNPSYDEPKLSLTGVHGQTHHLAQRTEDPEKSAVDGWPPVPADAHFCPAAAQSDAGAAIVRRTSAYHDGHRPDGAPDARLAFVCRQADPTTGLIRIQLELDGGDHLTRFTRPESGVVLAVPGGASPGQYAGRRLLEA